VKRVFIKIEGIVQGVGFRPFVYKLAKEHCLKGWVNNNSEGVHVDIQGEELHIEKFIYELKTKPCFLAKIDNITTIEKEVTSFDSFEIKESNQEDERITLMSPDVALCNQCSKDIKDPSNRRYRYAFTNCTNCGPRFSIIKSIPYDRDKTTMNKFKMCDGCFHEYSNPLDRRFHAQPIACNECGPRLWIEDSNGNQVYVKDEIEWVIQALKDGKVLGIKGIGGFHLSCDGESKEAIDKLRGRKKRPHKPLGIMMKDIETVRKYCHIDKLEEEMLSGYRKPIVILRIREPCCLPDNIAPNQNTLGVMLPYTPLHDMLFDNDINVLVMTSGNVNGLPIEYENKSAVKNLGKIADYFVMHNRDIFIPVDDSVVRVMRNEVRVIRRARGYVPEPIKHQDVGEILACGSNMLNTFAISKEGFIFLSQHNGDLENLETYEYFKRNIKHFRSIFNLKPKYLSCDMHEGYISTQYAMEYKKSVEKVQHHHAHIASCMAENNVGNSVIGVAFDGTGYGIDRRIWGSEFLICDYNDFERKAHLKYIKMPGGEMAVKEPWRMAVAYIYDALNNRTIDNYSCEQILLKLYGEKALKIVQVIKADINCPETSSMGRLFDVVASIIGLSSKVTYEGQAAMELESLIRKKSTDSFSYAILNNDGEYSIDVSSLIIDVISESLSGRTSEEISRKFHNTIINLTLQTCCILREESNINEVALSGGVFQNSYLLENIITRLEKESFKVYTHKEIPCNDGGIALGQIMVCSKKV
jgi:hydrogenase maturation protein HypF